MRSMISVNDRRNWFLSFDIACDGREPCNDVKYMVGPAEPEVRGSNPLGPTITLQPSRGVQHNARDGRGSACP